MFLVVPKKRKDYSYTVSSINLSIKNQLKDHIVRVFNLTKPTKEVTLTSTFEVINK